MSGNEISRRWFMRDCGVGLGAIALADLLRGETSAATVDPLAEKKPHFAGKAKNVIYLFMAGAPSHLEMFDYKPQLAKFDGTLPPADLLKGYRAAFINPNSKLLGPKFKFEKHGQCGAEISELLPHTAKIADQMTIVKAMKTDAFNHAPAQIMMNTGSTLFGKPSLGAWTLYGLGSESRNLPGFVVFSSGKKGPSGGSSNWGSGFLPTVYQGVQLRNVGDPVLYLSNPSGIDAAVQRDSLDAINQLNQMRLETTGDPEIATRINSFEMAYRMQSSGPELMDVSSEPQHILDMYGVEPDKPSFAKNCLLARRLIERGTRFVQLFHEAWDQHGNLKKDIEANCLATDQACAALVQDLKQRGMLDDTLVIWGGEFGRTPMVQGGGDDGRDHHPNAFTIWMAGGGTKPGVSYGETDDFGFNTIKDQVHVHDLHATILHLLGFDHNRLSVKFQGLSQKLTGVEPARVVKEILA
ncbi:DUF1501 domain-containing protein [Blastopirellula sp. JC732]|uniref:DUF1501 domain-containing protein n=1 Tax=Blastopirellula sediminis TaxID=2894196 RepID=A0A9X1MKJ5_9BACT|nr:DUF1501 domain-containing protein [Blastopirellula sediminis]MCC9608385.1 DUF1501 domain-containing protein [Blastopirellula sediminis]MCC9628838.1 DUF1501 domain-containing protein [Blastopirellula sediminis]